jgi:hypothetical protein
MKPQLAGDPYRDGFQETKRQRKRNKNGDFLPVAAPIIAICHPVFDYELFRCAWNGTNAKWANVSVGDKRLEKPVRKLSETQRAIYVMLVNWFMSMVNEFGGMSLFHDPSDPRIHFRWAWCVWHRVIVGVASSITAETIFDQGFQARHCWFSGSHYTTGTSGRLSTARPKYNFSVGNVRVVETAHKIYKDKFWYLSDQAVPEVQESMSRLVCAIRWGLPPNCKSQASHLCHNLPQVCVNPEHIIWELPKANQHRNYCVYGSQAFCPHLPKCVFTSIDGRYLPHRNHLALSSLCDCESINCMGPVVSNVLEPDNEDVGPSCGKRGKAS